MTDEDKNKKRRGPKPKHRETIRKLHDAGYKPKDIQDETGASKGTVSKELKKYMEDDPVNYYKVFSSDEELKASQKIEPMPAREIHTKKALTVSATNKRAPARNPDYPQKKSSIKLNLNTFPNYQTAIRHALDNSYRWTKYNIQEIKTYLKDKELKLNPVNIEVITTKEVYIRADILMREYHDRPDRAKELYEILGIEWKKPACSIWIERRLHLWEISHEYAGLKTVYRTTKEWYKKMEIDFPQSLGPEADDVITNRNDLERSGIVAELEHKIKEALGIDDEMENLYHTTDKLTKIGRFHIQNLIRENPNHPYSVLLKDKIQYNELKTDD